MTPLKVRLSFDGPVLSAGVSARRVGLDVEMRRNSEGAAIIAGSHLEGRLREALEELLLMSMPKATEADFPVAREAAALVFGREAREPARNLPSAIHVGDLQWVKGGANAIAGETHPVATERSSNLHESDYRAPRRTDFAGTTSSRVAIDIRTGTARRAALAFMEAERVGRRRTFEGTIDLPDRIAGILDARDLRELLLYGLRWLRHVGKNNTAGWGRIERTEPEPSRDWSLRDKLQKLLDHARAGAHPDAVPPPRPAEAVSSKALAEIGFVVVAHGPLLIADGTPGSNVFEGRTDIPGSVTRRGLADVLLSAAGLRRGAWVDGTVAAALRAAEPDLANLAEHFEDVRASFALPVLPGDARSKPVLPLPATAFRLRKQSEDSRVRDALAVLALADPDPAAMAAALAARYPGQIVEFLSRDQLRGYDHVAQTLQVHVAKSRRTGAAQAGQLFATRAIAPIVEQEGIKERARFAGVIRCPKALEQGVRAALVRIERLGKATGRGYGRVQVRLVEPTSDDWSQRLKTWQPQRSTGADYIDVPLMLVTDALLIDARAQPMHMDLRAEYEAAFKEILGTAAGDALVGLRVVMAFHRLWGGATARGSGSVPPALLTRSGSAFLLRFAQRGEADVQQALDRMVRLGIERRSLLGTLDDLWRRRAPLGADNGYGQIRIAHEHHQVEG